MTVHLVGAGPGDPGLITVRGRQVLERADVVIYDRLSVAALLELAPPAAERISVGKTPGQPGPTQDDINDLLIEHGRTGRTVVRLKGGDPFVFARGGEEARALAAAGIAFEVVPGITSAIAVPAYAGIPVTMRHSSTSFTVVTGHTDPAHPGAVDWDAVARVGGTIVILMGVARIAEIADALMAGGRSPDEPVAAVRWGTRPTQHTIRATLGTIAARPLESPSTIVVGPVAGLDLAWFDNRPLFGRSVVVTRAEGRSARLSEGLAAAGAHVIEVPTIEFAAPADGGAARDAALATLDSRDWLVFTSATGVEAAFESSVVVDARSLAGPSIAAIGPATAAALAERGVVADLIPDRFVSEGLIEVFPKPPPGGGSVLMVAAEKGRTVADEALRAAGWQVDRVAAYRTVPAVIDADRLDEASAADAITFTSGSTVEGFVAAAGVDAVPPVVVCIGPVVADVAAGLGIEVSAVAEPHTVEALVAATVEAVGVPGPTIAP